uniref:SPX, N-terminal; EXS, C-terminal n=1 Tax=Solanum tuberosum TaxID=4113 RepID=M0ZM11_SOLTU
MKFGKEFTSQMVHEWQEAYMDYNYLKNLLKDLLDFKKKNAPLSEVAATPEGSLKRRISMYRAFSGLQSRYTSFKGSSGNNNNNNHEDEVILVNTVQQEGSQGHHQTMFLMSSEEGGEYEMIFFKRLDDEFNKVSTFYKKKVGQVKAEADELSKQMDALIALRIMVEKPSIEMHSAQGMDPASVVPLHLRSQLRSHMEVIQEVEMSSEEIVEDESTSGKRDTTKMNPMGFRPAPVGILDNVKINIEPATPISTLKNVIKSSKSDLSFSRQELRKAEEQIRMAFVEFYQKLRLLKNYSFLNVLAFSKIMKKYDKITSRKASKSYLEMIDKSYLGSSDEVAKLVERVEVTFIKHFVNGNRRKGMKSLRPQAKRDTHRVTFFMGMFSGCSIALVAAIAVVIRAGNLLEHKDRGQYMDNIFPLYSLFGYIVLHMLMYAGNVYYWKRFRVNYPFIFGFKQGTALGYRQVLLLASGLSLLALAAAFSHLDMDMDPKTRKFETLTELIPLTLVIVTLPDFILADQLTSQVQAIRSLQFYVCYYVWGNFKTRSNKCQDSSVYKILYIVVAIIPFWSRFIQCLRRLFEEKDSMQGLNGLKYFSTIVALVMKTLYSQKGGTFWRVMAASTSGVTTVANTYWDLVIDWGLLQRNSKNPWLRDKLLVPHKIVYFVAIVLDIILRLVWMQLVLDIKELSFLHEKAFLAVVACLEILRRGIWNFFRLENEHLNNVGKYRAFKSVPLPFNYDEDKSQ